jgi:hypothetical protein
MPLIHTSDRVATAFAAESLRHRADCGFRLDRGRLEFIEIHSLLPPKPRSIAGVEPQLDSIDSLRCHTAAGQSPDRL